MMFIIVLYFLIGSYIGAAFQPHCGKRMELRAQSSNNTYVVELNPLPFEAENTERRAKKGNCVESSLKATKLIPQPLEEGLAMTVINERSAKITLYKVFPLYLFWVHWSNLIWIVKKIPCGRIVVFGLVGDGAVGLRSAKAYLSSLGSVLALHILPRTNWIWVYVQCGATLLEIASIYSQPPLNVSLFLPFSTDSLPRVENEKQKLRRKICEENEILSDLCDQTNPEIPHFTPPISVQFENLKNIPVIITAGGRLHYFYFTLKTLLQTPGIDRQKITVIIGGKKEGFIDLLNLFDIHFATLEMYGMGNGMLFQYYRRVYQYISDHFPSSPVAILIDEDVEVSLDFFHYMNQTIPLLEKDSTIYCINAYSIARGNRLFGDPTRILRGTSQVAWGYAVSLKVIQRALTLWPTNPAFHTLFDMWIMLNVANNRECVFPERTRSIHFGIDGENFTESPQDEVFSLSQTIIESFGVQLSNVDDIPLPRWRAYLMNEINTSEVLTGNPCRRDFIPPNANGSFSFFLSWDKSPNNSFTYAMAGMCLGFWSLSSQAIHDGVATIKPRKNLTLHIVAVPASTLSYLKPRHVSLWDFTALNVSEQIKALQFKDQYYSAKDNPLIFSSSDAVQAIYQNLFIK